MAWVPKNCLLLLLEVLGTLNAVNAPLHICMIYTRGGYVDGKREGETDKRQRNEWGGRIRAVEVEGGCVERPRKAKPMSRPRTVPKDFVEMMLGGSVEKHAG